MKKKVVLLKNRKYVISYFPSCPYCGAVFSKPLPDGAFCPACGKFLNF